MLTYGTAERHPHAHLFHIDSWTLLYFIFIVLGNELFQENKFHEILNPYLLVIYHYY